MTQINPSSSINKILAKVIKDINDSKGKIVTIIEKARTEQQRLREELEEVRNSVKALIELVDDLEYKDKIMRKKLVKVSKGHDIYTEEEVREVYSQALEIRTEYMAKQNEEKILAARRTALEMSLRNTYDTIEMAEKAMKQINIAMNFLDGEVLSKMEFEDREAEMFYGIKILEAQENERKRISRDIHDGPAQYIANILMKADICEKVVRKDVEEGIEELRGLKTAVAAALKEVRDIIYDLRPMSLDDLGLNKTIEEFVKKINENGKYEINIRTKLVTDDVESIIQVAVFRIIQEITNNIKKHARADQIHISLDYGTKYLKLIISDNGVGFDVDETLSRVKSESKSYGLIGILERVHQLQGEIDIQSTIGKGTTFTVKLPISREVIKDEQTGH